MLRRVRVLQEYNPMLGNRGVRCGISFPEIYDMQIQAIFEAAAIALRDKIDVRPEIMIPNVCTRQELVWVKPRVEKIHKEVEKRYNVKIKYKFGTMVEIARACVRAARIAEVAEFFSFGTNDLTQGTFSFSREDAENKFLPIYNTEGILRHNPFEILDELGVGWLMEHRREGRAQDPAGSEDRHLRRTRRPTPGGGVLPPHRPELCVVLAHAHPHRPHGRGPRHDQGKKGPGGERSKSL